MKNLLSTLFLVAFSILAFISGIGLVVGL